MMKSTTLLTSFLNEHTLCNSVGKIQHDGFEPVSLQGVSHAKEPCSSGVFCYGGVQCGFRKEGRFLVTIVRTRCCPTTSEIRTFLAVVNLNHYKEATMRQSDAPPTNIIPFPIQNKHKETPNIHRDFLHPIMRRNDRAIEEALMLRDALKRYQNQFEEG